MTTEPIPSIGLMFNPAHPGESIKMSYIQDAGLSVTEIAAAVGMAKSTLSRILAGKARLTADVAIRLEKALGVSAGLLLRMQVNYDEWQARQHSDLSSVREIDLTDLTTA